jgi:hypothetical protein
VHLAEIRTIGHNLIPKHDLQGWLFGFNSARRRMGVYLSFPHGDESGRIDRSE